MLIPTILTLLVIGGVCVAAIIKRRTPKPKTRKQRELKHGSRGKYGRDQCRCTICVEAHEIRKVARRKTQIEGSRD